jgi:hypothetical protein
MFNPTWACTSANPREACSLFLREAASISADSSVKRGTVKSPAISSAARLPSSSDFFMMSRIMEHMHSTAVPFVQGSGEGKCNRDARCKIHDAGCKKTIADFGLGICMPPTGMQNNGQTGQQSHVRTAVEQFPAMQLNRFSFTQKNASIGALQ